MSRATKAFHRIVRGNRARTVLTVVLGVLLATTGLVGGAVQVLRVASAAPAPATPERSEGTSQATALVSDAVPAVAVEPAVVVRRQAVGEPSDFPGSLGSAPPDAVAAYQRAAAIMTAASDCGLDWTVLAAIGRVESDHGRGPAVGELLDIPDTDLGKVDGNELRDAPVGPMRLLPATWAVVAVDADDDGVRNPQDVDDAALAAAVLLCAGGRNLASLWDLVPALASYHPAPGFVRTVLALVRQYDEEAARLPAPTVPVSPLPVLPDLCACRDIQARSVVSSTVRTPQPSPSATPSATPSTTPSTTPSATPSATETTTEPTDVPTGETSDPTDGPTSEPTEPSTATTTSSDPAVAP
ncbi:hypothetical protein ACOACQ_07470 [Nocardioides sp. CPCC 206347]|uniref:hypothetical protein n=1 Tax=unclassified Nocardioides TaxID=2615069 RepID=UPI0036137C68